MRYTLFSREDEFSNELCKKIHELFDIRLGYIFDDHFPDLVICVGGDGTILRAIHYYVDQLDHLAFVGIHTGTLGFFTDYTSKEFEGFVKDVLTGKAEIEASPLLEMRVNDEDEVNYAFNEFRIGNFHNTVTYDISIDGEFFEQTTGSGICVATQAGSTGANRGLMGAVVDNGLDIIQLNEIMPVFHKNHHSLRNPYIMKSDRILQIEGDSLKDSAICADYLEYHFPHAKKLEIRTSPKKVYFARFRPYSYLKRLGNLF